MVSMRSRRPSVDASIPAEKAAAVIGGAKTIGLVGGVALLLNNITGSAMVLFPSLYQAAGWFLVTLALLAVCGLSYVCSIMIIEAMAAMPGNAKFDKRVEYTTLAYYYLGRHGYGITQLFFQLSLACNNISSIIQSVQVMDFAIAGIFGHSCATPEFYPHFRFACPPAVSGDITVFGNDVYLLSIGFIITALVCAPLGFWNLDDNIVIQKVSCALVNIMVMIWVGVFIAQGLDADRVPTVGTQFTNILGTTVFNFAVITSIPSWVNEKKERVSILATMGMAMPLALVLFTVIGLFGGMAYEPWFNGPDADNTLLNKLKASKSVIAQITFYLFPVVVNLTSIPVFAIMQRYNLLEAQVCGPKMANFLGVVLPWLICIPFYTGTGFSNVVNWGGIVFNSAVNFIIPPLIYIAMVRRQQATATKHMINDLQLLSGGTLDEQAAGGVEIMFDEDGAPLDDDAGVHRGYVPPGVAASKPNSFIPLSELKSSGDADAFESSAAASGIGAAVKSKRRSAARGANFLAPPSSFVPRPGSSSLRSSLSPLGSLNDNSSSSLRASLLGGGGVLSSYAAESGLYDPSEIDVRTAEEEEQGTRILGYNPFEAAAEEERQRQQAIREAAEELKKHRGRVTLAVPSIGDPALHINYSADMSKRHPVADGSEAPEVAVIALPVTTDPSARSVSPQPLDSALSGPVSSANPSLFPAPPSPTNSLAPAGSFLVLSKLAPEPWQAMPAFILPHRILLGKAVAATLTVIAVVVIILNIVECAKGNCN